MVDDAERACDATNVVLGQFALSNLSLGEFLEAFELPLERFFAGLGVADPDLATAGDVWNSEMAAHPTRLARGAEAMLASALAYGLPVGVVSAAATEAVEADAEQLGIRSSLSFVTGRAASKRSVLQRLVEEADGRVLYLGDTEYDMIEAVAAGAIPIGVAGGYRPAAALSNAGATYILDDLGMLLTGMQGF